MREEGERKGKGVGNDLYHVVLFLPYAVKINYACSYLVATLVPNLATLLSLFLIRVAELFLLT